MPIRLMRVGAKRPSTVGEFQNVRQCVEIKNILWLPNKNSKVKIIQQLGFRGNTVYQQSNQPQFPLSSPVGKTTQAPSFQKAGKGDSIHLHPSLCAHRCAIYRVVFTKPGGPVQPWIDSFWWRAYWGGFHQNSATGRNKVRIVRLQWCLL